MDAVIADVLDLDRRFGGLRRLYGDGGYERLRASSFAVVGLGGVGSWAVEALARSGVASLVLIDMDHVAESNINRQVQALTETIGMAKGGALAQRIGGIHPACRVHVVDAFVEEGAWPALLPVPIDVLIDACDQVRAKALLAAWALRERMPMVCAGAAGGKRDAAAVEVDDLARVTHDPLLASLRQRLRRDDSSLRGAAGTKGAKPFGLRCVFSREPVSMPQTASGDACEVDTAPTTDGSLNCAGYGSSVMVTASFGMAAAAEAVRLALLREAPARPSLSL
jgi:tRNA A37 threonylcarbamoyladenosine dehydratase